MSLPEHTLGTLTDRELLLLIYGEVSAVSESVTDHEARLRILEAANNQTIGRTALTGGGSGAIGGSVVALALKFLGWC